MFIQNRQKHLGFQEQDDVNPMDYLSNLSDVMLVLAVGIMLALVSAFHVNLAGEEQGAYASPASMGDTQIEVPLNSAQKTDRISKEDLESAGFTEYGTVFTDSEGNLYVLGVPDEE